MKPQIEFKTDIVNDDFDYYVMIEDRIDELTSGHSDITGAAATLNQPAAGRETPYIFEANVVVYTRPNNVHATSKDDNPQKALKGALDAVERQVRKQRDRLKDQRGSLDDLWLANQDESDITGDQ